MAIPPLPLSELSGQVDLAVLAEVIAIWDQASARWIGDAKTQEDNKANRSVLQAPIGAAPPIPAQRCQLRVEKWLKGQLGETLFEADKPAGAYLLAPGHRGPFLLSAAATRPIILGHYGPDSYSLAEVESMFKREDH